MIFQRSKIKALFKDAAFPALARVDRVLDRAGSSGRYPDVAPGANLGPGVELGRGVRVGSDVTIGDFSYANRFTVIENADIGKYCSISANVNVNPAQHELHFVTTHPVGGGGNRERPRVYIGNDVLIGLNVVILAGVKIADGAVVGAGSVVTHDVGPYEVVAGVPARILSRRFPEDVAAKLLATAWWDWPRDRILANKELLRDPHLLVSHQTEK